MFLAVTFSSFLLSAGAVATALVAVLAVLTAIWNIPIIKRFRNHLQAGIRATREKELDEAFSRNINGSLVRLKESIDIMNERLNNGSAKMEDHEARIEELEKSSAYLKGVAVGLQKGNI